MKDNSLQKTKSKYMQKAIRICLILRFIPFLRMIGLNGSMVRGEFFKDSDIDFIIICEAKRMYFVRQLVMFLLTIFRLKRSDQNTVSKICPNRWATTNRLQITPKDDYHAWTFSSTIPIYSQNLTYQNFVRANSWMREQGFAIHTRDIIIKDSRLVTWCKTWLERRLSGHFGNYLESRFKQSQIKRIKSKTNNSQDQWNIRINDDELCFHLKKEYVTRNIRPLTKTNG